MKRRFFYCVILCQCIITAAFSVIPAENSTVNSTAVYFEDIFRQDAVEYRIFLYTDSTAAFAGGSADVEKNNKLPAFWINDLKWGTVYFWKLKFYGPNHVMLGESIVHRFRVQAITYQSFDEIRMDVRTNKSGRNNAGLLCVDYTRSLYDRKGKVVWTIPLIAGLVNESTQIRDLKLTRDNTFTFLTLPVPAEIDLDGNVLWKAPYPFIMNGDTVVYHHELTKTKNGTYLVLGDKKVWRKVHGTYSDEILNNEFDVKIIDNVVYKRVLIAILLEFNREGALLWSWDANDYLKDVDLTHKKAQRGFPNMATHANAFSQNEAGTKVYVGFRDLSRIVKIDKKTKKVELTYGEKYPSGEAEFGNNLFKNQHGAGVTKHNSILIFNNNGALSPVGVSSILELKDNITIKDNALLWRFDLNFDTLTKGKSLNGGNATELPNGNILLCAGSLNRIFEVTRTKEIVWDAFMFARGKQDTVWQDMPQYRCSWIKELKRSYFMCRLSGRTTTPGKVNLVVSLSNTGNYDDSYEIEVLAADNRSIYKTRTPLIRKNTTLTQALQLTSLMNPATLIIRSTSSVQMQKIPLE